MRTYATDRQLVLSILAGVYSHPLIQNPNIYYPLANRNEKPKVVKIEKYRTYAGRELLEPGLTLSVYPRYKRQMAMEFSPYTLGNPEPGQHLDKGVCRIVLQLSIQDAAFDSPYAMALEQLTNYSPYTAHGRQIAVTTTNTNTVLSEALGDFAQTENFRCFVSPAEEVLREYTSLLRAVLRDQQTFQPFIQRNLAVKAVEYLTPEVFEDAPENLVFHKSLIHIELDVFEPPSARNLEFLPSIETVNIAEP